MDLKIDRTQNSITESSIYATLQMRVLIAKSIGLNPLEGYFSSDNFKKKAKIYGYVI